MNELPNQPSSNQLAQERTEFAKFRTREAADRTLMAWMRTSLSLISFGFGIPTLVDAVKKNPEQATEPDLFVVIVGLSFILIGVLGLVNALRSHHHILKVIHTGDYAYSPSDSDATGRAALGLILVGVISFVGVIIKNLFH